MQRKCALVLSSGGSRGALQAGAIQALFETGYIPDLMTGASIGAANAAFLAVNGFTQAGIDKLHQIWEMMVDKNLMPSNLWWQTMRMFFRRSKGFSQEQIRAFAISNGITPDLCFSDLKDVEYYPVASDLDAGIPIVFGRDPNESVLESMLASMALPPWIFPVEKDGHHLMDGGAVSSLPIEAALLQGATEIIALDLFDPNDGDTSNLEIKRFFSNLDRTVESRHKNLELELAESRGIPVTRISLTGEKPVPIWDFRHSRELFERGYQLTNQLMREIISDDWPSSVYETGLKDFEIVK